MPTPQKVSAHALAALLVGLAALVVGAGSASAARLDPSLCAPDPDTASAIQIDNHQDLARLKSILEEGGS